MSHFRASTLKTCTLLKTETKTVHRKAVSAGGSAGFCLTGAIKWMLRVFLSLYLLFS